MDATYIYLVGVQLFGHDDMSANLLEFPSLATTDLEEAEDFYNQLIIENRKCENCIPYMVKMVNGCAGLRPDELLEGEYYKDHPIFI